MKMIIDTYIRMASAEFDDWRKAEPNINLSAMDLESNDDDTGREDLPNTSDTLNRINPQTFIRGRYYFYATMRS